MSETDGLVNSLCLKHKLTRYYESRKIICFSDV